jgi:hypothetical protein
MMGTTAWEIHYTEQGSQEEENTELWDEGGRRRDLVDRQCTRVGTS